MVLPPSEVGGDELLHSVARFQREMLRKREEQQEKQSSVQQEEGQLKGSHVLRETSLRFSLMMFSQTMEALNLLL